MRVVYFKKKMERKHFLVVLLLFAIDLFFPVSRRIVEECHAGRKRTKMKYSWLLDFSLGPVGYY